MTTAAAPREAPTSTGRGEMIHEVCTDCFDGALADHESVWSLCGADLSGWTDAGDGFEAGEQLCVVCEALVRCPSCGALLVEVL